MCEEMLKLRKWLDDNQIEWNDHSWHMARYKDYYIDRTHFNFRSHFFSVINGMGTYGGMVSYGCKNQGLLEVMIDGNEPIGNLTADEVIEEITCRS